jgi:predicted alpha/beta superfamily hydrolase
LNEGEQGLFRDGQAVFTMITRIQELEAGLPEKMAAIQARLQEKIKQNNVNGRFTGYLKQMNQGSKGVLYDKRR